MSRPVIHAKRWHGVIHPTLAACGLWLSTACGDGPVPEQEWEVSTRAQAVEGDSCDPDTTPPVVTCDAEAIEECGVYLLEPKNFKFEDACGMQIPSMPYPTYAGVGTHSISASVRDGAGNTSSCTTVYRVYDTEPPNIFLTGPSEITLTVDSTYEEQGAYYHDDCMQGSYGGRPLYEPTTGSVNTHVPGTYVLTYSQTDNSGNTGTEVRTVKVVPSTPTTTQTGNTTQSRLRHTSTLLGNGRVLR